MKRVNWLIGIGLLFGVLGALVAGRPGDGLAEEVVGVTRQPTGNGQLLMVNGQWLTEAAALPLIQVTGADAVHALQAAPNSPLSTANYQLPTTNSQLSTSKTAVLSAAPGQEVGYTLRLVNSGATTQTVSLSDILPPQLALVAADDALTYDPDSRALQWTGELAPGHLAYSLDILADGLPYLDLGGYGLPNLCDRFTADGGDCDEVSVTFNLGAEGYSVTLYGQRYDQLRLSANGLLFLDGAVPDGQPHWLPTMETPGLRLAGLWQDLDMTTNGRWHAALLIGYLPGQTMFYAQWHDAPQAANPDLSSRFAIALPVAQIGQPGSPPTTGNGEIYYLYNHISQPEALIAAGYVIGLQDSRGERGFSYAYAGPDAPPRGTPPAPGMTLRWRPHFYGTAFSRTFYYQAEVVGAVPETAVNTIHTTWSDGRSDWATHYLAIRHHSYLPLVAQSGGTP